MLCASLIMIRNFYLQKCYTLKCIVFPAYSLQLLKLLQDKMAATQDLMNTVLGFRQQLTTEEQFSQNINRSGPVKR